MPAAERGAAGTPASGRVHRADRVRDWIALGLVIVGTALYAGAHRGMDTLARDRTVTTAEESARGQWKMVRWNRFERMSRAGIALVAAGAAVSIFAFARHAQRRREARNAA